MREDIKEQSAIVKRECHRLAQIAGYDRFEVRYVKQKKFNDDGILDLYKIDHFYSS